MTECRIYYKNEKVKRFEIEGHAGYAAIGRDIVCAAVSTIVQGAVVGLARVAFYPYNYNTAKGFLECDLLFNEAILLESNIIKAQAILATMVLTLEDIAISYPSNVAVTKLYERVEV